MDSPKRILHPVWVFYDARMVGIPMGAGIFVGGRSSRMGRDKTCLPLPEGRTLLERTVAVIEEAGLTPVLVGRLERPASLGHVEHIDDAAVARFERSEKDGLAPGPGIGPIAGLLALLRHAAPDPYVLALSCDLPHLTPGLLEQLARAPDADVAMPRAPHQEPLCARYRTSLEAECRRYAEDGGRSLRGLLQPLQTVVIEAAPRTFRDWDTPADVEADLGALPW